MKVVQAYRFALDPTPAQERMLRSHAGAARFAWNWGLAKCQERYAAERKWYSAKTLLTGVDDRGRLIMVAGPRPLRAGLRRLRRASRAHSRKRSGSAGRRRSAVRLARIHSHVASLHADALHKATTKLAARYETVVGACGAAVRPGQSAGRAALKQEPGIAANAGQTGTAAHQAAAA
jgi:transposase